MHIKCTMDEWLEHGPFLCQYLKMETVEITDKSPHYLGSLTVPTDDFPCCWDLQGKFITELKTEIPLAVFSMRDKEEQKVLLEYQTLEEAKSDLSAMCMLWATTAVNRETRRI